jgi:heme oxygenase
LDLDRLRLETAVDHVAVEVGMPLMVEDLDRDSYVRCLRQTHGIVAAWEEWSSGSSPAWMHSLLENRQRQGLLERDLAWFGVVQLDTARPGMPERKDDASLFDGRYARHGHAPGQNVVRRLAGWLDSQPDFNLFESHRLQRELPWTEEIGDIAAKRGSSRWGAGWLSKRS